MKIDIKAILNRLKQYPVACGATLLFIVFGILLFIRSPRLSDLEANLETKEQEWSQIEDNVRRSKGLDLHVEEIRNFEQQINKRLLNPLSPELNYDYFYDLERESGVTITNQAQGAVVDPKSRRVAGFPTLKAYEAVSYTLNIKGSFPQILEFATRVSNGKFVTRISGFNLTKADRTIGGDIVATIQMQILSEKQQ